MPSRIPDISPEIPPASASPATPAPAAPAGGPEGVRLGRAVIYGLGRGSDDGHWRYTAGDHFHLVGGSDAVHAAMQRKAEDILREIESRGLRLDRLTPDEAADVRVLIESRLRLP